MGGEQRLMGYSPIGQRGRLLVGHQAGPAGVSTVNRDRIEDLWGTRTDRVSSRRRRLIGIYLLVKLLGSVTGIVGDC